MSLQLCRRLFPALLALALLGACSKPPVPEVPPKPLRVMKVSPGGTALLAERSYSGELRPRVETTLGFQVAGKIVERLVNIGDHVRAGQVLARLDPVDTRLTEAQAEAQRRLALAEATRYRELSARHFVSKAALDDRENRLKAAEAQAALAKNQTAYTVLIADKPGIIGLVLADVGQVVTPGQGVLRMAPDGDREIAVSIPESEYAAFKVGMPAEVSIFALPEQHFVGRVREISPAADPATRTYPLRIQLDGIEKLPTGLTATVRFPAAQTGGEQAQTSLIAVPLSAVFQQGDAAAVWLLGADNTVNLQRITIARFTNDHALVAEGLRGGETIAVAGVNSLTAGQLVRPVLAAAGAAQ